MVVVLVPRRRGRGAGDAEPDGAAGRRRGGGRRPPVRGHGVPHDARAAVPAAVQDAARVVHVRVRQQRD